MAKKKKKKAGRGGNLVSKLKAMGAKWKKGSPRRAGAAVPDGEYEMRIESMVIGESKSSGRMQVTTGLIVIAGDFEGRTMKRYSGLDTDDNIDYLMGDLEALEIEVPDDINDLGAALESAIGLEAAVTVRTNDSFTNYDFQELLVPGEAGEEEDEEEADEDEEVDESDETEDEEEAEDAEEDEAEEDENEWPSPEVIKKLKKDDLFDLAKEAGIKNAKKKYAKKTKTLAKVVIDAIYESE